MMPRTELVETRGELDVVDNVRLCLRIQIMDFRGINAG